jgi:flagellar capping protein FliD
LVDGSEGVLRSLGVMDANGNKALIVNEAKDARVSFDGQEYSSASNTATIQGVNLTLIKASESVDGSAESGNGGTVGSGGSSGASGTSGTSGAGTGTTGGITLTVTSNDDNVVGAVRAFVDSYNRALDDLGKYQTSAAFTDSAKINHFRSDIVALAQQEVPELAPGRSQLSYIGLTFENGGKLDLDEAKLKERLANDRSAVSTLFTAPQGVAGRFDHLLDGLTQQSRSLIPEPGAAGVRQLVSDEFRKITGYLTAREAQLQSQAQVLQQTITQIQRSQVDPLAKLSSLFGPA